MRYENYIFDLYGTLVDIRTDEGKEEVWEKLALFYGYYDAHYTAEKLKQRYAELVSAGEKNMQKKDDAHEAHPEIKLEQVFKALFEEKGIQADMTLAVHAGQFFRILSTEYVKLYDGTLEMLAALKEAGKKVYLLSNAQRIFTEYELHTLGIARYFDDIFISSECGVKKPDSRFFNMLIEKHNIDTAKSIMIGNDGKSDIEGARKVGLSTFYIHSNISPKLPIVEKIKEDGSIAEEKILPEADIVLPEMDMKQVLVLLKEN